METPMTPVGVAPTSWQRLRLLFTRPAHAFDHLSATPHAWLVPACLVALLMTLPGQTVLRPLLIERQQRALTSYVTQGLLSPEEAVESEARILAQAAGRTPATALVQGLLAFLAHVALRVLLPATLLFTGARFVMDGQVRMTGMLGAVAFAAAPAGLRELLRAPLQAAAGTLEIHFGPAALTGTATPGGYALGLLDLFDLWIVGLLVVGVGRVAHLSPARALGLVLPLWILYGLMKLAVKASPLGSAL